MICIDEIPMIEFAGKRVLVRAGLDLSLDVNGQVSDMFRVEKALPTLKYLKDAGAHIIIFSHIGRDPSQTNQPVADALKKFLPVVYVPDIFGAPARDAINIMRSGEILLLENLRQHYDFEKTNDESFARNLASLGDIYINDAFSNSHRKHASMVGIPKLLPHYAGFLLRDEVQRLSYARTPISPSLAILGGAKFETKEPLIKFFLDTYDHVFVAGALANDIFKARGLSVGISLISEGVPTSDILQHPRLLTPIDVTVERSDKQVHVKKIGEVMADERIVDMGPDSLALIAPFIAESKFILWNGPTGMFEHGYGTWTQRVAELTSNSEAQSIIGGGDTITAIKETGISIDGHTFLSTGGGAMLEYLLKGTLPGIDALD